MALLLLTRLLTASVLNVSDFGAVAGEPDLALCNLEVTQAVIDSISTPNSVVLIPDNPEPWYFVGGIDVSNAPQNTTVQIDGNVVFEADFDNWPFNNDTGRYSDVITAHSTKGFTLQGGGSLNGDGKEWWNRVILGTLDSKERPYLIYYTKTSDNLVQNITIYNPPRWSLRGSGVRHTIRYVHIYVDRWDRFDEAEPGLQPEDLNTDGLDVSGRDIHIHDVVVVNNDDSIAIKPTNGVHVAADGTEYDCTENVLVENVQLTGFGATIGSVGPSEYGNCANNVTFRNVYMPNTGKGIYVKSDKSDCPEGYSSSITNILYEDVCIVKPVWWALWIGPQQQHEPHQKLGGDCSLAYPVNGHCPTQGCTTFANISLRNVYIEDPIMSPGVILGNVSQPMSNIWFDNVQVYMTDPDATVPAWPFDGYHVENVVGGCVDDCSPNPFGQTTTVRTTTAARTSCAELFAETVSK